MSKQLTFSATIAFVMMATFALATTLGEVAPQVGNRVAAAAPLAWINAAR
jgi:hypothetical protein